MSVTRSAPHALPPSSSTSRPVYRHSSPRTTTRDGPRGRGTVNQDRSRHRRPGSSGRCSRHCREIPMHSGELLLLASRALFQSSASSTARTGAGKMRDPWGFRRWCVSWSHLRPPCRAQSRSPIGISTATATASFVMSSTHANVGATWRDIERVRRSRTTTTQPAGHPSTPATIMCASSRSAGSDSHVY